MLRPVKPVLLGSMGLLLSTAAVATGCGGGGGHTMRATLTDNACTYEGDTTPAPGMFNIEVENKTAHFAEFNLWTLASGVSVEDVVQAYAQAFAALKRGKKPKPGFASDLGAKPETNAVLSHTDPEATSVLPVNASSGRLVIVCYVESTADTRTSSSQRPPPAAIYVVPVEIDVG
jgi:hypothetical protein